MQYKELYNYILIQLANKLPKHLHYHNVEHVLDVIDSVERIGMDEHCSEHELIILKSAALLHDYGFIHDPNDHEKKSCELASEILPSYAYSQDSIHEILNMIMATKMPQRPNGKLSKILCDADLSYLGTDKYVARADLLRRENAAIGKVVDEKEWWLQQIDFLSHHHYFTQSAKNRLESVKQQMLSELRKKLDLHEIKVHRSHIGQNILDFTFIIFGVLFASLGLKGFLVPNHFFDGGLTGISMLLHEFYHFDLGITIFVVNLPFIIASIYTVGRKFALRTVACVIILAMFLKFIPELALTEDKLLIAIFGGVFLGMGIGFIMRTGAALDGIEVLALFTLKRTSFTITEIIMGLNIIIFTIAAFNFGIETALYSILTYFAATRTIDYVVEGIQAHTGVTIVSSKSELIKEQLVNSLGKAITVYKGERGYLPGQFAIKNDCDIIFMVISRLEMRKIRNVILEIDPTAFMFANTIKEAAGGILRRLHKH